MNHVRMNLVASVTYLASLGIVEFPLFGIAIEGSIGTVICAWCGALKVEENMEAVGSVVYGDVFGSLTWLLVHFRP